MPIFLCVFFLYIFFSLNKLPPSINPTRPKACLCNTLLKWCQTHDVVCLGLCSSIIYFVFLKKYSRDSAAILDPFTTCCITCLVMCCYVTHKIKVGVVSCILLQTIFVGRLCNTHKKGLVFNRSYLLI